MGSNKLLKCMNYQVFAFDILSIKNIGLKHHLKGLQVIIIIAHVFIIVTTGSFIVCLAIPEKKTQIFTFGMAETTMVVSVWDSMPYFASKDTFYDFIGVSISVILHHANILGHSSTLNFRDLCGTVIRADDISCVNRCLYTGRCGNYRCNNHTATRTVHECSYTLSRPYCWQPLTG